MDFLIEGFFGFSAVSVPIGAFGDVISLLSVDIIENNMNYSEKKGQFYDSEIALLVLILSLLIEVAEAEEDCGIDIRRFLISSKLKNC